MLKAIIVDDMPANVDTLAFALKEYCSSELEVVARCYSAGEGLVAMKRHKPDLVFLDVEMPGMDGFQFLEVASSEKKEFEVIFTTRFEEFARKAIKVSALDYLVKPIQPDELQDAVRRAVESIGVSHSASRIRLFQNNLETTTPTLQKVFLPGANSFEAVTINEIMYFEGDRNWSKAYTLERKPPISVNLGLGKIEEMLSEHPFFRVHNSYFINLNHIVKIISIDSEYKVEMPNGEKLNVARSRKKELFALSKIRK